jgi:hypothetical protein
MLPPLWALAKVFGVRLYHHHWVRHEVAWSEWNSQKEGRLMSVT